jgi:predicted transposase YbfD/YdcC
VPSCCLVPSVAGQSVSGHVPREVTDDVLGGFSAVRAACGGLAEYLDQVVDHRSRQGLRYELGYVLAVVVAATACAGHDEVVAQAQWVADAPEWVLRALGAKPDPLTGAITAPSESTLRRVLAKVDAADLQRLTAQWVAASAGATRINERESGRLAGVAIDGKSVRGAAAGGRTRPHLLAAVTHEGSIVLAQRQIPDKGSEISELATLVAELDLAGTIVTVDALHTQRATAEHLVSAKSADYIMTIKANQPGLLTAAQHALSGPAADFVEYIEQSRGHGRTEERIVRTTTASAATPEFPHAAQLFRVLRYTGDLDGQRHSKEVAYCVTSLTPDKATAEDLATLLRQHWGAIENRLHWVRDTTFNEDASTLRTGTAPQAMAIIRNTLIAAFRLAGWHNLKQARRHFSHAINRCVDLITKPVETVKYQT